MAALPWIQDAGPAPDPRLRVRGISYSGNLREECIMQIGVYGSGYLATVISGCLADFGTPVCCCRADGARMVEAANGNIPFYEKNLQEVIRRNERAGRLFYTADPEDLARKAPVIFLAEDSGEGLEQLVSRLAASAGKFQVLSIVTPGRVGSTSRIEKAMRAQGLKSLLVCQPMFFTNGCAVEDFNWPDRIILGTQSSEAVFRSQADLSPACDARRARAGHQLRDGRTGAPGSDCICGDQNFFHQ